MKKTSCALIAGVSLMLAGAAHAGTIDFDDMNTDGDVAIGASYLWVGAAFYSVSFLNIARDTGWYAMDDFTTTDAAQVPGPGSPLMLAIGLLALGAGRHQARRPSARTLLRLAA